MSSASLPPVPARGCRAGPSPPPQALQEPPSGRVVAKLHVGFAREAGRLFHGGTLTISSRAPGTGRERPVGRVVRGCCTWGLGFPCTGPLRPEPAGSSCARPHPLRRAGRLLIRLPPSSQDVRFTEEMWTRNQAGTSWHYTQSLGLQPRACDSPPSELKPAGRPRGTGGQCRREGGAVPPLGVFTWWSALPQAWKV